MLLSKSEAFVGCAAAFLAAGAAVAVWRAAEPIAHGWWLVAFLVLVGGIAQLLLGAGQRALSAHARRRAWWTPSRQAVLWNAGAVLVPLGVIVDARLGVVAGSVLLLVALAGSSLVLRAAEPATAGRGARRELAYAALLAFLAVSVLVGVWLGWDRPWV